jgi:ATP-dependent protease Clp ATPase subunit
MRGAFDGIDKIIQTELEEDNGFGAKIESSKDRILVLP